MQLRQCVGAQWWNERVNDLETRPEVKRFAVDKLRDLDEYDKNVDEIQALKDCLDRGEMTGDDFIVAVDQIFVVN